MSAIPTTEDEPPTCRSVDAFLGMKLMGSILLVCIIGPSSRVFAFDESTPALVRRKADGSLGRRNQDDVVLKTVADLERRQHELECMNARIQERLRNGNKVPHSKENWANGKAVSSNGAFCTFADTADGYLHYRKRNFFHDFASSMLSFFVKQCSGGCEVAELGASSGLYGSYWQNAGINVTSFDGTAGIETVTKGRVRYLDLASDISWLLLKHKYDFVTCIEVLEHIPRNNEADILLNIAELSRLGAIITWAAPGQRGNHHVNERPKHEVVSLMKEVGLIFCPSLTEEVKMGIRTRHLRANLLVLRKTTWSCT